MGGLKIPTYDLVNLGYPSEGTRGDGGQQGRPQRGAEGRGGGGAGPLHMQYVWQDPEVYHHPAQRQVITRTTYDLQGGLRAALAPPPLDPALDARSGHRGVGIARQVAESARPRLTRQIAEDICTELAGREERARLTRQGAVEQRLGARPMEGGALMAPRGDGGHGEGGGGHLRGPPDARSHGAERQSVVQRGGLAGAPMHRGGAMEPAHNPLGALQSLTHAQALSAAHALQPPAHMTRQMTDAHNFALRTASMVSGVGVGVWLCVCVCGAQLILDVCGC